jgi:hypothetical protein
MCVQQDLKLHMTMVQGMPWMTLHSVPTKDLRRLQAWAQHTCDLDPQSRGFVINACDAAHFDPELYHKYRAYVTQLDHIRGTDHDGVFHPTTPDLN